ncbi:MAG: hypothetical protein AB4368_21255 [Xenococcaceae cyanobacterium]
MSLPSFANKIAKNPSFAIYKLKQKIENELEDIYRSVTQKNIWSKNINQKEIRIAGLRRTGNHAIISWIQAQEKLLNKGAVFHINNVVINENPYRYKYQNLCYHFPQHKWSIEQFKQQKSGNLTSKYCLIYSYEDYALAEIFSHKFEQKHDLYLGKTQDRYDLLIIRDPFNLLASRLKNNFLAVKSARSSFADLWLDYAKEYLGETNRLQHNKVCVNYNLWVNNKDYRQEIASKLNIEFTDVGIDTVHGCGGGSSFDGREFDGQANKMDVNNRWKHYLEDPTYRKLINNDRLLEYSYKIFGYIPGTEELR